MRWEVKLDLEEANAKDSSVVDCGSYTANVDRMYLKAGLNFNELDGMKADEAAPVLTKAIDIMLTHSADYLYMPQSRKFGNYHGAVGFLMRIRDDCEENPQAIVKVW